VPDEEEWPPREARLTSALWRAEDHFDRCEFFAAAQSLDEARGLGEDAFVAALRHLAAAGYRAQNGERARARRQLEHGRRRLAPFLPKTREIALEPLLDAVALVVESADGEGELA
jgi:hypothetical protein